MPKILTCSKHPKYQVKRKPTGDCSFCWGLWNAAQTVTNTDLKEFAAQEEANRLVEVKDRLRKRLRSQAMSLQEISNNYAVKLPQAKALVEQLIASGSNVCKFDDKWQIVGIPEPVEESKLHVLESDKNGHYHFGALGDSHYCSKYERNDVVNDLYSMYSDLGITDVFHCGNWIDGEARFNKFDIKVHGLQNQLDYIVERYPQHKGIVTKFVAGDDHEGWYNQREGVNIGRMLQDTAERAGRFDLKYLGYMESFISLKHKRTGKISQMLVSHPGGGSAYAYSYSVQKIIEAFQGGEKPAVALFGHFHKMSFDLIRNVWALQVGCQKDIDPFARKKRLTYHLGGCAVQLWQDEVGAITDCQPRFKQYFDRGYYQDNWSLSGPIGKR